MATIDKHSLNYRAGFEAGADAERDRINRICSTEAAQKLPAEAVRAALATDLDWLTTNLQLTRTADLPEERRGPLETRCGEYDAALRRDLEGRTIRDDVDDDAEVNADDAAPSASDDWGSVLSNLGLATNPPLDKAHPEREEASAESAASSAGNHGWDSIVATLNATIQK